MGWGHNWKPAKGAKPILPSKGQGWGGPAKGASTSRIKRGDPEGIQAMSNDPEIKARAEARAAELKDHIYTLAKTAERQETQLAAAVHWLDREEGKSVSRSIVHNVADPNSLTDADLVAIIEREQRGQAAAAAPIDPPRSDRVEH